MKKLLLLPALLLCLRQADANTITLDQVKLSALFDGTQVTTLMEHPSLPYETSVQVQSPGSEDGKICLRVDETNFHISYSLSGSGAFDNVLRSEFWFTLNEPASFTMSGELLSSNFPNQNNGPTLLQGALSGIGSADDEGFLGGWGFGMRGNGLSLAASTMMPGSYYLYTEAVAERNGWTNAWLDLELTPQRSQGVPDAGSTLLFLGLALTSLMTFKRHEV